MINRKYFGVLLLSISLLAIGGFALTNGVASVEDIDTPNVENQIIEKSLSSNADPAGTQTTGAPVLPESKATGAKFSGEIVACTNITEVEQVIDLRLSNLDVENQSISVFPLSTTIELLTGQIKRIDIPLPYAVSTIKLVSSNEEELTLGVPPCVSRGGESASNSQRSFFSSTDQPPPPVPELSTMALTGVGVLGLIFIISRRKQ